MSRPDITDVSVDLLLRMNKPIPRYTSYPTAPEWHELPPEIYQERLLQLDQEARPLSLYVHIPFCRTMCLFCGCSVILNRRPENEERYVEYLCKELTLVSGQLNQAHSVRQLHFGGGTPTKLSVALLQKLLGHIENCFAIDWGGEISIEIDPRTVVEDRGHKLRVLKELGFNRVSFGVQDTNPKVQEAIKRHQSYAMTLETYKRARELGYEGINLDLIYGLPYQTPGSFADTIEKIIAMGPDRIALFSYAQIPWLKAHQKAIPDETLPSPEEKFAIYVYARKRLMEEGYVPLGMDHFARREDPLAQAYFQRQLHRNFQGYSLQLSQDMLGFGVTSIGFCQDAFIQNIKDLDNYYAALDEGRLPVLRGKVLTEEDRLRRWTIHSLMCHFELDGNRFKERFGISLKAHFAKEQSAIAELMKEGLLEEVGPSLVATPTGRLFIRNIASVFDAYLGANLNRQFSKAV